MHRLNISYKQFYVTLNEIWLFESDPNGPSTWSERGGKQWQRSIRGRRNWDVELGPCAVIRHLCSVAFVWETKRPQADNSRSLIDRQVSCFRKHKDVFVFSIILQHGAGNWNPSCIFNPWYWTSHIQLFHFQHREGEDKWNLMSPGSHSQKGYELIYEFVWDTCCFLIENNQHIIFNFAQNGLLILYLYKNKYQHFEAWWYISQWTG